MGIGAPKAGTTRIADLLGEHPEVCLSEPKEIHYFNSRMAYFHPPGNANSQKDYSWYEKHYKHCKADALKGEFSTGYLFDLDAPKRIKERYPDIKLIVCMRHPANRAYSQYIMFREYFQKEKRPFDEVMKLEDEFIGKSLYYKQISHFLNFFNKEQMHFIFLEDLKDHPKETLQKLYGFLGVEKSFVPEKLNAVANKAKRSKFPIVSTAMGVFTKTMISLGLSGVVESLKKAGLKDMVISLNSSKLQYEKMSDYARQYVLEQTIPDTEKLETLLERDLSHWKV